MHYVCLLCLTFTDFLGLPYLLTFCDSLFYMAKEILGTSKLTHKFQTTIPKEVRERFALRERDMLVFIDDNGKLVVEKSIQK
jgi:AbrB family looped-hinge helix DNA binding protein